MLEKIKKYAPVAGIIFLFLLAAIAYSMLTPPEEDATPCPDCNVTITCPPCPEYPDIYVTVPSPDLTVPTFTEAEVKNIALNYISNLRDDPRTWFEIKSMTYGGNGNWTVKIKYECPGQTSSRIFIVIFNESTGKCF